MFPTAHTHDESGFTLLELVVTMCLFGMLSIGVFSLVTTALQVQSDVTVIAATSSNASPALVAMEKDVRLSTAVEVSTDSSVLYVQTQDGELIEWMVGAGGLTNGHRSFSDVTGVEFTLTDGLVQITMELSDGSTLTTAVGSRLSGGVDQGGTVARGGTD